jgi:predicted SAM-dependent methyltransferase
MDTGISVPLDNKGPLRATPTHRSLRDNKIITQVRRLRPLMTMVKNILRTLSLPVRPFLVSRYIKSHAVRKLQIGAHVCLLPGWLNSDLYPQSLDSIALDATRAFPIPDGSFDYVFSEHQMEHIPYDDALAMLSECRRILRRGGKIRVAVPSLDRLVELFRPEQSDVQQQYVRYSANFWWPSVQDPGPCFAFNSAFMYWGHKFLYDQATLRRALESVGFTQIQFFAPGVSDDQNLLGIEARTSEMDFYETVVAQAIRA